MSSNETFGCDIFYNNFENEYIPMDIYTAASLGDVSYFMKYDVSKLTTELSIPNQAGWTPLMYACSRGHSLLVNYLLMLGAKRNCKSKSGVTPLMLAVSSADISTVENIFDFSNLEEKDYRQWTALFYAVHFTRENCLKYLLSRGADVNIVDFQNETPLIKAIKLGRETMVELILKSARNLDVVSYNQESAIMLANESNNTKIQTLVKNRYEYLKNCDETENIVKSIPIQINSGKKHSNCTLTPLKQQMKLHLAQLKMSKSLTYSPNKNLSPSPSVTPKKDFDPWKLPFAKRFWSPQLKPNGDVEKFLKNLGLEKYWPIFRDEEVDYETLLTLNEENLKELGILFNPPAAPWWGGWWERLIGLVKVALRKTLGEAYLNYIELETLLCDIEGTINSRPLTYLSDDPNDLSIIRPKEKNLFSDSTTAKTLLIIIIPRDVLFT